MSVGFDNERIKKPAEAGFLIMQCELCVCVLLSDIIPVNQLPECLEICWASVPVIDVIGMFPNIAG